MICPAPPPAPAAVLFEESTGPSTPMFFDQSLSFADGSLMEVIQITTPGHVLFSTRIDPIAKAAELLAAHKSLNKKARQERMSAFEREYPW
jgi:hypothetical protein